MKKMGGFFNIHTKRHLIGIDIGSATLKMIGMSVDDKNALLFSSIIDLTRNRDTVFIKESIQKVLKDNRFPSKDAILTFSDESTIFRRTELPSMPQKEILDALRWKAKEAVLFNIYDASLEYRVLGEVQKDDGSRMMEILYVVVSKEAIEKAIAVLKEAGLNVIGVNVMPFGLENVAGMEADAEHLKSVVIVDFGYAKTEVSILKDKHVEFVRSIPFGSKAITDAMQEPITTDGGEVSLGQEDAEKIKRAIGIAYEEAMLDNGLSSTQILSLIRAVLEHFSKEIRRSVEYYAKEFGREEAVEIRLTGGGARLKNIGRYLSEELNLPIRSMSIPASVIISAANLAEGDRDQIVGLIGVVLGFGKQINLLPSEHKAEKVEFFEALSLRMIITTAAIVLLLYYAFMEFSIYNYKSRLTNIPLQRSVFAQIRALQEQVAEREKFLMVARASEIPEEYVMKELSNIIPREAVLSSLSISQRGKAVNMRGTFYGAKGSAQGSLTKFMEDMEKSKYFKDAQLQSVATGKVGVEDVSNFEIVASLE